MFARFMERERTFKRFRVRAQAGTFQHPHRRRLCRSARRGRYLHSLSARGPAAGQVQSWFGYAAAVVLLGIAAFTIAPQSASAADETSPEFESAAVTNKDLALTFSENLNKAVVPPADRFTVRVNGEKREVAEVSIDDAVLTLTLAEATIVSETMTVSYDPPRLTTIDRYRGRSVPALQDLSGNHVDSFMKRAAMNNSPACPGTTHTGDSFWSGCVTIGGYGSYRVGFINGSQGKLSETSFTRSMVRYEIDAIVERHPIGSYPRAFFVSFADDPRPAAKNWTLRFGDSLVLHFKDAQYNEKGHSYVWALSASELGFEHVGDKVSVSLIPGSVDAPPKLSGEPTVDGATLKLTFDEDLKTGSVPVKGAFDVEVEGSDRALASANPVVVSGKTVTLTLASAAGWREEVTVSYTKPASNPLEDGSGNDVTDFEATVVNETPNPRERGLVFDPESVTVAEGGSATYTVKLDRAPEAGSPVHVRVREIKAHYRYSDKVRISPGDFLLNTTNWNTGREVRVTALRDGDGHDNRVTLKHGGGRVRGRYYPGSHGSAHVKVTMTDVNAPPRVANRIPDQGLVAGESFSYTFPEDTFHDADSDSLSYSASRSFAAWPEWLEFDGRARTFSGTPQRADTGFYQMYVRADDGVPHRAPYTQDMFYFRVYESLEAQLEGRRLRPARGNSWSRSPSWLRSRSPEGLPGGCRVEVYVRFVGPDGTPVEVAELTADDFMVENGRLGTPVRDGEGWRVPVSPDPGFTGLMRVRLLARELAEVPEPDGEDGEPDVSQADSQTWASLEQVFQVGGNESCAPVDRTALASLGLDGLALAPAFDAGTTAYTAAAAADTAQTTVTASAVYGAASVAIAPADADEETDGHQVALGEGETEVTVTVMPGDGSAAQTYTVTVTREAGAAAGALTGFVLVDASTDADLGAVADGDTVTVSAAGSYGIRAGVATDADVGSVVLSLAGPGAEDTHTQTENLMPYSLYGDAGGAEYGRVLAAGSYTLTATAYAERGGTGEELGTLTVPFTVAVEVAAPPPPVLTGFVLVDVSDQSTVAALANGAEVDLGDRAGGSFGIRANVASDATVGSVMLSLSGAKTVSRTENLAPYSLYGDGKDGVGGLALHGSSLPAGSYTLSATAYAERRASGATLGTRAVSFEVLEPAVSVADARAEEGTDATLDFAVTLNRSSTGPVTVAYATVDGTATVAGDDYTATSGTLTFQSGEREKTVSVPVLDDTHDEGAETLTLRLSDPQGLTIADGEGIGTITNSDPLQRAWLARFGRTVGTHVTDAVGERLRGAPGQASHLTIGGYRLPLGRQAGPPPGRPERSSTSLSLRPSTRLRTGSERTEEQSVPPERRPLEAGVEGSVRRNAPEVEGGAKSKGPGEGAEAAPPGRLAAVLTEVARVLGMGSAGPGSTPTDSPWLNQPGPDPRLGQSMTPTFNLDLRQVLLGSSFRLNLGATDAGAGTPRLTAWGRFAGTTFAGQDGDLALDGDVFTGTVGVDSEWDRLLAGVAVAHSRGDGSFNNATPGMADRGRGGLEQTLTSLHPYLRYAVTDRLDVWGVVGYGWGELDMETDTGVTLETDTNLVMGAFGGRGILLAAADTGGFEVATRTDAMLTRTSSDAVTGGAGNLAATDADAHRLRVILEGSRGITWNGGQRLIPSAQVGLRHDWGDAETGFGVEVGGRVQYADPRVGLTIEGAVRGLLAHEDSDYEEWGASGKVRLAPGAGGQGLALTLAPTWGVAASGVEGLWSRQTTQGLAPQGSRPTPTGRLQAEVGYGVAAYDRGLLTPYAGTVLTEGAARTYRVGMRWAGVTGLQVNLEGTRQESAGQQPVNQGVQVQATWGF